MKPYEPFEHTADVGLRIYGKDLNELFVHAAKGLFDLIAEVDNVQKRDKLKIEVQAVSQEELLVAWLRELLYVSSTRRMVLGDFRIRKLGKNRDGSHLFIQAEVFGEKIKPKKHILKKEVKAVTYHGLVVRKARNRWVAEVIFDV